MGESLVGQSVSLVSSPIEVVGQRLPVKFDLLRSRKVAIQFWKELLKVA